MIVLKECPSVVSQGPIPGDPFAGLINFQRRTVEKYYKRPMGKKTLEKLRELFVNLLGLATGGTQISHCVPTCLLD